MPLSHPMFLGCIGLQRVQSRFQKHNMQPLTAIGLISESGPKTYPTKKQRKRMAVLTRKPEQVRNLCSCVKGFFKVALPLIAALLVFTYMTTRTKYSVTPPTIKYLAHTAYHRDHKQTTDEHARSRENNQTTATETRAVLESSKKTAKCMNIIEHDEMKVLCKMYEHGMITGDMCSPLCEEGLIQITECATAKHLQKQVMMVTCTDACVKGHTVPAILKSELRAAMKKFTYMTNFPNSTHDDVHRASRDHITQYTRTFMGFDPFEGKDAFKVVWGQGSAHDLVKEQYAGAVWRSLLQLVSLTRPSEYMLLRTFADKGIFPQIYGSCGHFYVEESCPSRPQDWIPPELAHLNPARASWIGRAQDALKTLDVLQRLETNFPDQFIHCDIKYTNFGVCGDGTVRIIDSNSMVFQSMTPGTRRKACQETGAPCNVIGKRCEGICDALLGTCVMKHNPNLEPNGHISQILEMSSNDYAPVAGDISTIIIKGQCQISFAPTDTKLIWHYSGIIMVDPSPALIIYTDL